MERVSTKSIHSRAIAIPVSQVFTVKLTSTNVETSLVQTMLLAWMVSTLSSACVNQVGRATYVKQILTIV